MNFILSLVICSAVAVECQPSFKNKEIFDDWSSCIYHGYNDSIQLLNIMGDDYINKNQILIKFGCTKTEDKAT